MIAKADCLSLVSRIKYRTVVEALVNPDDIGDQEVWSFI